MGIPRERRSAPRSIRDASEKSTTASVASASVLTLVPVADGSTRPSASTPKSEPGGREHHRRGDGSPLDARRDRREAEEDEREDGELPVHRGSLSEVRCARVPRCPSGTPRSSSTRRSCARCWPSSSRSCERRRCGCSARAGTTRSGSSRTGGRFASRGAQIAIPGVERELASCRASPRCSRSDPRAELRRRIRASASPGRSSALPPSAGRRARRRRPHGRRAQRARRGARTLPSSAAPRHRARRRPSVTTRSRRADTPFRVDRTRERLATSEELGVWTRSSRGRADPGAGRAADRADTASSRTATSTSGTSSSRTGRSRVSSTGETCVAPTRRST